MLSTPLLMRSVQGNAGPQHAGWLHNEVKQAVCLEPEGQVYRAGECRLEVCSLASIAHDRRQASRLHTHLLGLEEGRRRLPCKPPER